MVQGGRAQKAGDELRPLLETLGIVEPRDGDSTWADLDTLIGPVAWAWEGWLPEGMLTLIVGQFCEPDRVRGPRRRVEAEQPVMDRSSPA